MDKPAETAEHAPEMLRFLRKCGQRNDRVTAEPLCGSWFLLKKRGVGGWGQVWQLTPLVETVRGSTQAGHPGEVDRPPCTMLYAGIIPVY